MDGDIKDITTALRDHMAWWLAYERGYREPRYQVPAIRQGFEYGLSLPDGRVTLLCWRQGVYDA